MEMIDPILVTGPARSGTSMVAGIISLCGVWGGNTSGPNRHNKRGMFENTDIRNTVVKPFLRENELDSMAQKPLPEDWHLKEWKTQGESWRKRILAVIKNQGYESGPWYYKGAKMVLMWTIWHAAFPNAKWIYVRRNTEDIVWSCMRTGFMRAYKYPNGWRNWVAVHLRRKKQMVNAGLDVRVVSPEKLIRGQFDDMRDTCSYFGLDWNERDIREFVSPNLWGGKHA